MPNKLQINSVTNANVYVNGGNLLGRAMEVTPPEVKLQMVEHKGLGMMASIEVPSGGMDKLETKFKFTSVYADVLKTIAGTRKVVSIQVRASIDSFVGGGLADEVALVMTLNGVFMSNTLGGFKQHEATQPEALATSLALVADLLVVVLLQNRLASLSCLILGQSTRGRRPPSRAGLSDGRSAAAANVAPASGDAARNGGTPVTAS